MAQGGGSKFPPEIKLSDNDPSKGCYTIVLTIPGMKVKSTRKGLKKIITVENGTENIEILNNKVSVDVNVNNDSKEEEYCYNKPLPEDITPSKSTYELKNEKVKLILKKNDNSSWGQYADHFTSRS